jgi:hypothetical protein
MYDKVRTRTDHGYRILSLQLTLSVGPDRPEVDENLPDARIGSSLRPPPAPIKPSGCSGPRSGGTVRGYAHRNRCMGRGHADPRSDGSFGV